MSTLAFSAVINSYGNYTTAAVFYEVYYDVSYSGRTDCTVTLTHRLRGGSNCGSTDSYDVYKPSGVSGKAGTQSFTCPQGIIIRNNSDFEVGKTTHSYTRTASAQNISIHCYWNADVSYATYTTGGGTSTSSPNKNDHNSITSTNKSNQWCGRGDVAITISARSYDIASYSSTTSFTYDGNAKTCVTGMTGCSVASGTTNSATKAGDYSVTIKCNTGYEFSDETTSKTISWKINKAANGISFSDKSDNITYKTTSYVFPAATGANGTVTYSFVSATYNGTNTTGCSVTSSTRTITLPVKDAGKSFAIKVKASASGDDNYLAGEVTKTFTLSINRAGGTVTFSNQSKSITYGDTTCSVNAASGNTGTLSYSLVSAKYNNSAISGVSVNSSNGTISGLPVQFGATFSITVQAKSAEGTNYQEKTANSIVTITINKRSITITGNTASKVYDGKPLEGTASRTSGSLVSNQTATYGGSSITNVGSIQNVPTVVIKSGTTDVTNNYDISKINGKLTVTKANVNISVTPHDGVYTKHGVTIAEAKTSDGTYNLGYSLTKDGNVVWSNNNSPIITTSYGTFYIWYKVTGDGNHNDVAPTRAKPDSITVTRLDGLTDGNKYIDYIYIDKKRIEEAYIYNGAQPIKLWNY